VLARAALGRERELARCGERARAEAVDIREVRGAGG
jgi:hypothetical protein